MTFTALYTASFASTPIPPASAGTRVRFMQNANTVPAPPQVEQTPF